ncbi:flagellar type III secretion system protein FliR [Halobacillus yeomjeoni]|uniref:Flagellar biosynthetic protein FliR n=1 Tax=Halobacillus yeomjeoni TaxID=311194 RepID=A0A931MU46_9BACI|nr:flagellar biosynthetic protein FliR [Halobacillus yeomjeoni]MBH0229287.1 flagellar type III secretion system protein FliR [Halobacillus yeomjeoni]MCA0983314.1 flagellar type III secretion system protein FliR [Halobacillus yeomjeoni]
MLETINFANIPAFLLIMTRILAFFATLPIFSYRNVPTKHKVGFSFFLALLMYYTVPIPDVFIDGEYFLLLFKEAAVGIAVGLLAYIVLAAIQIAGGFIDFQMGFAIANVIDPQTGAQSPLIGQFLYIITLLFILAVNGHHLIIDGVFYSYEFIALDKFLPWQDESWILYIIQSFNQMFIIAFLMAVPIVGCLFLVDIALGIVARTVPQLNVFVVGLPLKIFVALAVLVIAMTFYIMLIKNLFETMLTTMRGLMQLFGG